MERTTRAVQEKDGSIVADRPIALAGDKATVVPAGHADARATLCAEGEAIPADTVKRLRLFVVNGHVKQKPKEKDEAKDTKPTRSGGATTRGN